MSKSIKITMSDENYKELEKRAGLDSVQDYIRKVLFPGKTGFTPNDAAKAALKKFDKGKEFSVPEIYGDDWNLPNGEAGNFGRKFHEHISTHYSTKIHPTGKVNKKNHAVYKIL